MARGEATSKKLKANDESCTSATPTAESQEPSVPPACYSIKTFCRAHHISTAFYFELKLKGLGPREMRIGTRVLITHEAAADWRRKYDGKRVVVTAAAG
jgi:hypothetical protein